MKSYSIALLGVVAAAALGFAAQAAEISGAGATFPYPIYAKWAAAYAAKTGLKMNYQSIGSGGGIAQINAKTVDFGASDMPLKPEVLAKDGLTQFPPVIGGEVMVVNLPGIKAGRDDARRPDHRRHLSRQDHQMERSGDRQAQSRAQAAVDRDRCGPSLRRLRHDLHLHQLPLEGKPRLEDAGRRRHLGPMADRARRQRQ